jgi:hypothetical protein
MQEQPHASIEPTAEQLRYANILEKGMYAGLACLFVTFAVYVFGFMEAYIPLEELPNHWGKGVDAYLAETGIHGGWSWVGMLGYGDFLNFIGIAALAGVSILCYAFVIPILVKSKDHVYAVLAVLEVLVLVGAATGIVAGGH